MDLSKLKNYFLKIMIGCLVAAGVIAVTTVLTGHFNEIFGKSLLTILLIAIHALVSFGYIDLNEKNKSVNDLTFFHNTTFVLIVLSFVTSIFGVWGVMSGDLVAKLYATYVILLFAVLHGETLSKMINNDSTIDNVVRVNYVFMVVVVLLIVPVIYASDPASLGDFYYRILAAFGIIDAILTLVAIILNKLYLQKHPKVNPTLFGNTPITLGATAPAAAPAAPAAQPKKGMNILVVILIVFLGFQLVAGLVFAVIGREAAKNINKAETKHTTSQVNLAPSTPGGNYSTNSVYSYERSFSYNGYSYSCTQSIAGRWERTSSSPSSVNSQDSTFEFVPASISMLDQYCTRY